MLPERELTTKKNFASQITLAGMLPECEPFTGKKGTRNFLEGNGSG